jgi:hypothetical protein
VLQPRESLQQPEKVLKRIWVEPYRTPAGEVMRLSPQSVPGGLFRSKLTIIATNLAHDDWCCV